jgi:hypothetical protein
MKLFAFQGGEEIWDKSILTMQHDIGVAITIPIQFFLIEHPAGRVMFDTGLHPDHVFNVERVQKQRPWKTIVSESELLLPGLRRSALSLGIFVTLPIHTFTTITREGIASFRMPSFSVSSTSCAPRCGQRSGSGAITTGPTSTCQSPSKNLMEITMSLATGGSSL